MIQLVRAEPLVLRPLLSGALDYAGLFPPASLSLEQAVINYAKYREEPESWLLGRFICPARRMEELVGLLRQFLPSSPWSVSVLGTGGNDAEAFLQALADDLRMLDEVTGSNQQCVEVISMEVRWPVAALNMHRGEEGGFLNSIAERITAASTGISELFFELPARRSLPEVQTILQSIRLYNDERAASARPLFGAKIRCGGTEPTAFPSSEDVAAFLSSCTYARVPFKATAGLHHPLYHFEAGLGVYMHGFLNVFTTAVLLSEGMLDEKDAVDLLADGEASHFEIGTEGLAWKNHSISVNAIARARKTSIVSFGSCSFDEPREDLRNMGFM